MHVCDIIDIKNSCEEFTCVYISIYFAGQLEQKLESNVDGRYLEVVQTHYLKPPERRILCVIQFTSIPVYINVFTTGYF